ncbi:radical SAM protein [Frankia sp. CiP1_Cm_nod2]|uniref:radical SAM protein n=1 Tax=Frankia sp. CiP1_Cm_nod2 TaxID=2897161 RepID=UPI0020254DEA
MSDGSRGPVWQAAVLGEPVGGPPAGGPSGGGPSGENVSAGGAAGAGGAGDRRIRCLLCPHGCELGPGETGVCAVRRNHAGVLETATYTLAVQHLDAIERKPLYHVRPGSRVLTIAGPGCSFRCNYCVNHRLSQYGQVDGVTWTGRPARPAELVERAAAAGASLGMSYAEPGLAPELTLDLAALAAPAGVPIVWKTNGFLTASAIDLVAGALDAVNIDVKAADEAAHRRLTGAPLRPVLDAVERLRAAGVWVEVSTPLIPGVSAEPEALRAVARHLAGIDPGIPWHLLRFTPDFRMRRPPPTSPRALAAARAAGRDAGLRFVYVERALGDAGRQTRCPTCDTVLVRRGIWETLESAVTHGRCPHCGQPVPGRWGTIGAGAQTAGAEADGPAGPREREPPDG